VLGSEQEIQQVNLLVQPAPDGDFILTARLASNPNENFQQAGIFMILDGVNYVAILSAFCEYCLPDNGGYGVFMEGYKNNEPLANGMLQPRNPDQIDLYLRLVYSAANKTVTGYFAGAPDQWQQVGVVENVPAFYQVGLGAANVPGPEGIENDLQAYFDYFEIATKDTPVNSDSPLPQPTATPEPTATAEPTPLPEGLLFRDDFEGYLQPGWNWVNENPERWTFTQDGWLEIMGDNPAFYSKGAIGISNFLSRDLPEGEFMITAHVKANPDENFQQAAIYIFEDQDNYVALNIGYCLPCSTQGPGFFMETFIDNNPGENAYQIPRDPAVTDVYLRLVNQGGSLTGYYAIEPGNWQRVGAFGNYFDFKLVGLGTTNSSPGGIEHDIVSQFDYFEIAIPE
jgi:regulation of enolase protein 1 (concanavalin A-like superfamily)